MTVTEEVRYFEQYEIDIASFFSMVKKLNIREK